MYSLAQTGTLVPKLGLFLQCAWLATLLPRLGLPAQAGTSVVRLPGNFHCPDWDFVAQAGTYYGVPGWRLPCPKLGTSVDAPTWQLLLPKTGTSDALTGTSAAQNLGLPVPKTGTLRVAPNWQLR